MPIQVQGMKNNIRFIFCVDDTTRAVYNWYLSKTFSNGDIKYNIWYSFENLHTTIKKEKKSNTWGGGGELLSFLSDEPNKLSCRGVGTMNDYKFNLLHSVVGIVKRSWQSDPCWWEAIFGNTHQHVWVCYKLTHRVWCNMQKNIHIDSRMANVSIR